MVELVDTLVLEASAQASEFESRLGHHIIDGSLAQLVERLPYTQNVGSSRLSRPTKCYGALADRLRQQIANLSLRKW